GKTLDLKEKFLLALEDSIDLHEDCTQRSLHEHAELKITERNAFSLNENIKLRQSVKEDFEAQTFQLESKRQAAMIDEYSNVEMQRLSLVSTYKAENLSPVEIYERACNYLDEIPCELVRKQLNHTVMDVHDLMLGDAGFLALCAALEKCVQTSCLNASGNGLSEVSIANICMILGNKNNLTELDFSRNPKIKDAGLKYLANFLNNEQVSLSFLDFSECDLTDRCSNSMAIILKNGFDLKALRLASNQLSKLTCKAIGQALREKHCGLEMIDLSLNHIVDTDVFYIAEALEENESLQILNLSSNVLHDIGLTQIGKAIASNQILQKLIIRSIDITEQGTVIFAEHLSKNQQLNTLDLSNNSIGTLGSLLLAQSVCSSESQLKLLKLKGVMVNDDFIDSCKTINEQYREFTAVYEGQRGHYSREHKYDPKYTIIDDIDLDYISPQFLEKLFDRDPLHVLRRIAVHGNYNILSAFKAVDEKGEYSIYIEDIKKVMEVS
ncbi:hypothetical protein GJ496_005643, partial [Pomphorhynchus laevis]